MSNDTSKCRGELVRTRSDNFHKLYMLLSLFIICTLLYYFGELAEFFGWEALRWEFFYGVHDIHRLLFLAPIIYAGYFFGVKAAIIITIIAVGTFLPRALFISHFPDPLLRTVLFIIIAGIIGYFTGRESEQRKHLEALVRRQRDTMLAVMERMADGVLIVGPDYGIRYMNPSMIRDFGKGIGSHCYECLGKFNAPCPRICKLQSVINGATERWEYRCLEGGETYEVLASPYIDSDGTACQVAILRKITQHKNV